MKRLIVSLTLFLQLIGNVALADHRPDFRPGFRPEHHDNYQLGYERGRFLLRLVYLGALFREPDSEAYRNVLPVLARGNYQTLVQIAAAVGNSPEFRNNVARRYSSYDIVGNLYSVLLNRYPDEGGLQNWIWLLDSGRSDQVVSGIVSSEEFFRLRVGY